MRTMGIKLVTTQRDLTKLKGNILQWVDNKLPYIVHNKESE